MFEARAAQAVVTVGGGRGFIVEGSYEQRYIVTAAHCLPELPSSFPGDQPTYNTLVGSLNQPPTLLVECVFVDPVSDLAVLSGPDGQVFFEEAEAYEALTSRCTPFKIDALPLAAQEYKRGDLTIVGDPEADADGLMLSLTGEWFGCRLHTGGRGLNIRNAAQPIRAGMSGSPILLPDGTAIGVVSISGGGMLDNHREGGPNPELGAHLPGWLLDAFSGSHRQVLETLREYRSTPQQKCHDNVVKMQHGGDRLKP